MSDSPRTFWRSVDLGMTDEPLIMSLLKYRQKKNRTPALPGWANLISSKTEDGKQKPILDLDFDHVVTDSTHPGHHHLYLNVPISTWRWRLLMFALYQARVIELGYFVWSIRRGANFVRIPGSVKEDSVENIKPSYGWFFKLKDPNK